MSGAAKYRPPKVRPSRCCGSCDRFHLRGRPGTWQVSADGRPFWRGRCACWEQAGLPGEAVTTLSGADCEEYHWLQGRAR